MTLAETTTPAAAGIHVFDEVLVDAHAHRAAVLALPFGGVVLGDQVFRGIAVPSDDTLLRAIQRVWRGDAAPTLSFVRRSPLGQPEPTYIHSDAGMGQWTAILYLTPDPPAGDGTSFWRDRTTDRIRGPFDDAAANHQPRWERWHHVEARFNRLLIFDADLYHSRGLIENYGAGDDARLIHVAFGGYTPAPSAVTIREAAEADIPALVAMAESFVAQTEYRGLITISPERLGDTVRWLLSNPDGVIWIAEQAGRTVGMLALYAHGHPWSTDRMASELVWWMEPAHRGSAGARLLARAEQWARARGAVLQMIAPNARLEGFYARAGYTPVERIYHRRWE